MPCCRGGASKNPSQESLLNSSQPPVCSSAKPWSSPAIFCVPSATRRIAAALPCPCFISFLKGNPPPALHLVHVWLTHAVPDETRAAREASFFQSWGCSAPLVHQTAVPGQGYHQLIDSTRSKHAERCRQEVRFSSRAVTALRKFRSVELDLGRTVCAAAGGRQRPLVFPGLLLALGFGCSRLWKRNTIKPSNNHICPHGHQPEGEITAIFSCEQPGFLKMPVSNFYVFSPPWRSLPSQKSKNPVRKGINCL